MPPRWSGGHAGDVHSGTRESLGAGQMRKCSALGSKERGELAGLRALKNNGRRRRPKDRANCSAQESRNLDPASPTSTIRFVIVAGIDFGPDCP